MGGALASSWEGLLAFFKREKKFQIHCGGWVADCVHQKKAVGNLYAHIQISAKFRIGYSLSCFPSLLQQQGFKNMILESFNLTCFSQVCRNPKGTFYFLSFSQMLNPLRSCHSLSLNLCPFDSSFESLHRNMFSKKKKKKSHHNIEVLC